MTSNPVAACKISCSKLKRDYLKTGDFLSIFYRISKIFIKFTHCEKKKKIRKLFTPKEVVLKHLKGLASEHLAGNNELTSSKHC